MHLPKTAIYKKAPIRVPKPLINEMQERLDRTPNIVPPWGMYYYVSQSLDALSVQGRQALEHSLWLRSSQTRTTIGRLLLTSMQEREPKLNCLLDELLQNVQDHTFGPVGGLLHRGINSRFINTYWEDIIDGEPLNTGAMLHLAYAMDYMSGGNPFMSSPHELGHKYTLWVTILPELLKKNFSPNNYSKALALVVPCGVHLSSNEVLVRTLDYDRAMNFARSMNWLPSEVPSVARRNRLR